MSAVAAPLRIGIAGLGTVGGGVLELLRRHATALAERCGRALEPVAVSARDRGRQRSVDIAGLRWHDCEIVSDPDGRPWLTVSGTVAAVAGERGVNRWHLSLSHDGGIASAMVVAEA